jgi:hypothetical protein
LHGEYSLFPQGDTYNSNIYRIAFIALAFAVVSFFYARFQRRADAANLLAGALVAGSVLLAIVGIKIPGASYLLTWPLLFGVVALAVFIQYGHGTGVSLKVSLTVLTLSIPAIVLFSPLIHLTFLAAGLNWAAAPVALVAILFGLLLPQVQMVAPTGRWIIPVASLLVALVFFIGGSATSRFDKDHPMPNSVFYSVNVDSGKAVWASIDKRPDEWTSQFLKGPVQTGPMPGFVPSPYPGFVRSEAPVLPLAPPDLGLVSETTGEAGRTLQLVIKSPRQAPTVFLAVDPNTEVLAASLDGKPIAIGQSGRFLMKCFAVPKEGVALALTTRPGQPVRIRAFDMSHGLPEIPGVAANPRPSRFIPAIFPFNDSTLVSKLFSF